MQIIGLACQAAGDPAGQDARGRSLPTSEVPQPPPPSRQTQVNWVLTLLVFLIGAGVGAGTGIGGWVGRSWIFEAEDVPPGIVTVDTLVSERRALQSRDAVLAADLDRPGRVSFELHYRGGQVETLGPLPTVANAFQVVVTQPGFGGFYNPNQLPPWIERVVVRAYKVGWDEALPLVERKHVTKKIVTVND